MIKVEKKERKISGALAPLIKRDLFIKKIEILLYF